MTELINIQFMVSQIVPIPQYSTVSLPASAWLLESLLLLTFWIHMLFVSMIAGSALVLFTRSCLIPGNKLTLGIIDKKMIRALPPVLSLTITTGIAPLLFVQTLYGHYSYSSNIFLGYFWLGSLVLLLAGFICLYLAGWLWNWKISLPALTALPLVFLSIAYIYTNNAILTIQPEHWLEFHRDQSWLHVNDAITIPRFMHNISYWLLAGGVFLSWTAYFSRSSDQTNGTNSNTTIKGGLTFCALGFIAMITTGIWYFGALPAEFRNWLGQFEMHNSLTDSSPGLRYIWLALPGLGLLLTISGLLKPQNRSVLIAISTLGGLLMAIMVLFRELIRRWYLSREIAGSFSIENWPVASQNSVIIVLLISFVLALTLIAIMTGLILKNRQLRY